MPRKKLQSENYNLVVQNGSERVKVSAPTILEALSQVKFDKIVGKISITISHLKKAYSFQIVQPMFFRKILMFNDHKLLFEKRAKQFLGEI